MSANVGFGASIVAMNAYIPSLAKEAPEVIAIMNQLQALGAGDDVSTDVEGDSDSHTENPTEPLLARPLDVERKHELEADYQAELSRTTSRISSFGIALGYGAGICLLVVALIPVTQLRGSTYSLRLAIGLSGIWWAVFTIPAALWLPSTRSTTLSPSRRDEQSDAQGEWNTRREIVAAWIRLGNMLRWSEIKKLRNTFKYLAAWFLLSDGKFDSHMHILELDADTCAGFTTITSTAILFGKTTLHMSPSALILIGVLTPSSGILGSLLWPILQRKFKWSNLKILVLLVILASMIPAYGCLGFIFQGRTRFGGLTTQGEMFGMAVYFGMSLFLLLGTGLFELPQRHCLWSFSRIRSRILRGTTSPRRRGQVVRPVLDNRQSMLCAPFARGLR